MPAFDIDLRDTVKSALARVSEELRPDRVNPTIGTAVKKLFQDHFLGLPENKSGFPTTNFWPGAARATMWLVQADGVLIRVDQEGVLYQWQGGDIEPSKTYLTIPATPEAYGHRAREFNLQFAIVDDGNGFHRPALIAQRSIASLVTQTRTGKFKHTADEFAPVVFYWLVRHAHKEPDPDVIPDEQEIAGTITEAIDAKIQAAWRKGGG
jgi:hypothetical protein